MDAQNNNRWSMIYQNGSEKAREPGLSKPVGVIKREQVLKEKDSSYVLRKREKERGRERSVAQEEGITKSELKSLTHIQRSS